MAAEKGSFNKKAVGTAVGIALPLFAALGYVGSDLGSQETTHSSGGTGDSCPYTSLPKEAQKQINDILDGAPSDDGPHDGKHFGNYEGRLPEQSRDYYREYTVKTPGLSHRGERRIVVGGGTETDPEVWFYTSDHYESFCSIPEPEDAAR